MQIGLLKIRQYNVVGFNAVVGGVIAKPLKINTTKLIFAAIN